MTEYDIVRSILLRLARGIAPTAPLAHRLTAWANSNCTWLFGDAPAASGKPGKKAGKKKRARIIRLHPTQGQAVAPAAPDWAGFVARLETAPAPVEPRPHVLDLGGELGRLLNLQPFDAKLLTLMIAFVSPEPATQYVRAEELPAPVQVAPVQTAHAGE